MIQLAQTLADSAESVAEQLGNNPDKVYFPNFGDGDNILKSGIDVDRVMFTIPGTNFKIYWYGFLIAVGIILAMIYGFRKMKSAGIDPDRATDAVIGGFFGAIIGARLYYVVFSDTTPITKFFDFRDGGLAVYGGILGAILVYRSGVFAGYADSIMDTMSQPDNVFTVLVMALIGGMVNLIVVGGGVTAFEKTAAKYSKTERGMFLSSLGIMALTSIDDGLNMLTASYASYKPAKENKVVREKLALFYSMLPTVFSSFFPLSLWGIFVTGTLAATAKTGATMLFIRSIPFNFFSIIVLVSMILFAFGKLPENSQLKDAKKRKEESGSLWPKGSEKYLSVHDTEVWGKKTNVILPIIVMAVSSVAVRSYVTKSLVTDSAVGLMVALAFMFLLYCFEKIMTPEQFHLIDGIADSTLPIILYLLTINFSTLLDSLGLHTYLEEMIDVFDKTAFLLPAVVFVLAMAVTVALGSSWSMYAVIFPIVLNFTRHLGISPALMVGAIAGAGIAGEKNCAFTAEAFNIANAVGINPEDAKKIRISYSAIFTALAAILYLIVGFIMIG